MYMDGVDFMPTSRNVLFGYHFKAIAAAGPIVGPITAANLWGWAPSLAWLVLGVAFIGWASDYSAIMVAVRNDGNSLSAISHKLIAPRTRTILFVFIFFYLMLLAGAFVGILAAILSARPDVPFGIVMLALMGLLAGQMMYRWKMDLILVTVGLIGLVMVSIIATQVTRPAEALQKTANTLTVLVTLENPAECKVGQDCHVQAYVVIDPNNWDNEYHAPYMYSYTVAANPDEFSFVCAGWGVSKSSQTRLVCKDDDVGHLYLNFTDPGEYKISVGVVDSTGNKARGSVSITVLP